MLMSVMIFLSGFVLLWAGGEWLVRGATALGERLQWSPTSVGLVFVALGTSAPEFAVSMGAAVQGHGDLAVGNVVGSNIVNIALVLGLAAMFRTVPLGQRLLRLDLPVLVVATCVVVLMLWDQQVSRGEALLLIGGLVVVLAVMVRPEGTDAAMNTHEVGSAPGNLGKSLGFMVVGVVALVAGAECVILGGERLALAFGLSEAVIALTLTAIGTGLPEIAATLTAAFRNNYSMALGNVVGSNLFNFGAVLGGSALVVPLQTDLLHPAALIVLVVATASLWLLALWRSRIERWVGAALVAAYGAYSVGLFM